MSLKLFLVMQVLLGSLLLIGFGLGGSPASIMSKLDEGRKIPLLSDSEISLFAETYSDDPLDYFKAKTAIISSAQRLHKRDEFTGTHQWDGWEVVQRIFSDPTCIFLLSIIVDRPDWWYMHQPEVVKLRECLVDIVSVLDRPSDVLSVDEFSAITNLLSAVIDVIYSPLLEKDLRRNLEETGSFPTDPTSLFQGFMHQRLSTNLSETTHLISSALMESSESALVSHMDDFELKYWTRMRDSNFSDPLVFHITEFIASVIGKCFERSRHEDSLALFNVIINNVSNFDRIDWEQNRRITKHVNGRYAENRMYFNLFPGSGTAEGLFVEVFPGPFLETIWDSTLPLVGCFPSTVVVTDHESISDQIRELFRTTDRTSKLQMLSCLSDKVLSGEIGIPTNGIEARKTIASLLYMIHLTKSSNLTY